MVAAETNLIVRLLNLQSPCALPGGVNGYGSNVACDQPNVTKVVAGKPAVLPGACIFYVILVNIA